MWKPWEWAVASQSAALVNARGASTELSRLRVEREDVELFLNGHRALVRSDDVPDVGAG
jgi:hypothetical protein